MATMNMAGMNPAVMAAGGPVGGGMIMMNNGSPATQITVGSAPEQIKSQLNTYIYEYFLKLGHYDIARSLLREEKFELRTKPPIKQSPGRRKDVEVNGVDGDAMDTDIKDDIPDDLPRPIHLGEGSTPGAGFLFEWFSIFSDLFTAHRSSKMQGGQGGSMGTAAQYLMQHQNMQRMRENQQNQNLTRPGMMAANRFMQANMRTNMMNGAVPREMANKMTPQQVQQFKQAQMIQQQQQNQMQREQGDVDMNGRASSPAEGENGGSPSKRPRLEGQQFNGGMMPNARPGMPNVAPQNMMIQNTFNPNLSNPQFRQNGGMPQKPMQPGMANGMMNMANAGSPMMQGMNPQFDNNMQMDMYNQRMAGQQLQGAPGGGQSGNHALQDYQMQLMLLEQQNKKRLMMARQEQDNAVNRDGGPGGPMVGMQPGMSPGSRTGTSPNPVDQMKRTPQLGGLPGSPSGGDMARGSPAPGMTFMNGMPGGNEFNPMFMKDNQGMVPGGPGMRPPTSMEMQNNMARQQQQNRMAGQFQGGQPMVQNPSQGQPQPMGTPGQRNEMPPPQAPAAGNGPRNQGGSPQSGNAPPTPSTTNKPNPKGKKAKEDTKPKRPAKKNSTANPPPVEPEPPATPTPSTPITPVHPQGFNNSAGKGGAPGMPNQAPPPNAAMPPSQPQMHQPDLSQSNFGEFNDAGSFNLDFSSLENSDVLENFDFDSFLNTSTEGPFDFDSSMGGGVDFGLETNE